MSLQADRFLVEVAGMLRVLGDDADGQIGYLMEEAEDEAGVCVEELVLDFEGLWHLCWMKNRKGILGDLEYEMLGRLNGVFEGMRGSRDEGLLTEAGLRGDARWDELRGCAKLCLEGMGV